jgi:hypothetical protein
MLGLNDPKWEALIGGRRTRVDLRPFLQALESATDPTSSWEKLWDVLYHQGDIGDSAFAAVPHLVRIHVRRGVPDWNIYALAALIELARGERGNPDAPDWAKGAYSQALRDLAARGLVELPQSNDADTTRGILGLLAIVYGARTHGRVLVEFTEDEVLELEAAAWGGPPPSCAG